MPTHDEMVRRIAHLGVRDERILAAVAAVPRERFVPKELEVLAFDDRPLPIGSRQTISQPYIVARMALLACIRPGSVVLDVGTGSGYQAAVLAELGAEVCSIEVRPELLERARPLLAATYPGISLRLGDGREGWPERAPFDAILVAAATRRIPDAWLDQLKVGGRLVVPVGAERQELVTLERLENGSFQRQGHGAVAFVPLVEPA